MVSESSSGTTADPKAACPTSTVPTCSGVRAQGSAQRATRAPSVQIRKVAARDPRRSAACPHNSAAGAATSCAAIETPPIASPENPSPRRYGARYPRVAPTYP